VNDQVVVPDATSLRLGGRNDDRDQGQADDVTRYCDIVGKNNWEISLTPAGSGFTAAFEVALGSTWRSATSTVLPIGPWYTFAGTFDGSVLRIFVDGQLAGSLAVTGTISQTGNPLRIGAADGVGDFCASHDRRGARVERCALLGHLPTGDRGLHHRRRHARALAPRRGAGTTTIDSSGNGNTGTLNGPVWTTDSPFGGSPPRRTPRRR